MKPSKKLSKLLSSPLNVFRFILGGGLLLLIYYEFQTILDAFVLTGYTNPLLYTYYSFYGIPSNVINASLALNLNALVAMPPITIVLALLGLYWLFGGNLANRSSSLHKR